MSIIKSVEFDVNLGILGNQEVVVSYSYAKGHRGLDFNDMGAPPDVAIFHIWLKEADLKSHLSEQGYDDLFDVIVDYEDNL